MEYIVLVVLTLISCILFEYAKLPGTIQKLIASYRLQFKIMADKALDDESKQKQMMRQIGVQLGLLAKLIGGILLFVAPFLSLFLLSRIQASLNPDILLTWWGILLPTVTVIVYIFNKTQVWQAIRASINSSTGSIFPIMGFRRQPWKWRRLCMVPKPGNGR